MGQKAVFHRSQMLESIWPELSPKIEAREEILWMAINMQQQQAGSRNRSWRVKEYLATNNSSSSRTDVVVNSSPEPALALVPKLPGPIGAESTIRWLAAG